MLFKRVVILILCFSFILGSLYFEIPGAISAAALSVNEYEELIKELEKDQQEIENEIADLKSDKTAQNAKKEAILKKIDNLQSQINVCESQLESYAVEIDNLEAEIELKNQELKEARFAYMQRLRAIYMSGGITASSLTVLMSADGLGDLLAKSELTKSISAYDNALTNKLINDVVLIEKKKAEINALVAEQESVKSTLDVKKKQLNTQVKNVNSEIADINSNIGNLNNQKDALEKAMEEYEEAIKNAGNIGSDQIFEGEYMWPVPGYRTVTSPYGYRIHPIYGTRKFHKGIDISGTGIKGKPIVAAADGTVAVAKYNTGGYGYYVMINHGKKASDGKYYATLYAHMTKYIVKVGQKVYKGQTIGYVGTTGASTGYHLHFEIRKGNKSGNEILYDTTNPMNYF